MANDIRTRAITANAINYGESDLVVTLVTEAEGVAKALAKGAAKSLKRFSGCFEPFTGIEVSYRPGRGESLGRISSADVLSVRDGIRTDLGRIRAGAVMLELASRITVPPDDYARAYGLLDSALDELAVSSDPAALLAGYWILYMAVAGYPVTHEVCVCCGRDMAGTVHYPGGEGCVCGGCDAGRHPEFNRGLTGFIGYVTSAGTATLGRLRLPAGLREEIYAYLSGCTRARTGVNPRTLKAVLS